MKSSLSSLTIFLAYVILLTRMDKMSFGGYIKAIGRIIKNSLKLFLVVLILLIGFILAIQNRAEYKGDDQSVYAFDTMNYFNSTFENSFFEIYSIFIGNPQISDMGIDHFTWPNLINFLLYFVFLFLMSTLIMNIFTGIAINEIQNLINDSNIEIMKDKINYIYDIDGELDEFKFAILNKMINKYNKIMKSFYKKLRGVLDWIEKFVK